MAEMCSAPLQLGIGASIVLNGRTAGMCQSRTTSHWCQRNVDVVVVNEHCLRCRRRHGPVAGGVGGRSP